MSPDGRYIAFTSSPYQVLIDPPPAVVANSGALYVYDLLTGIRTQETSPAPLTFSSSTALSYAGRYLAFHTGTALPQFGPGTSRDNTIWLKDRFTESVERVSAPETLGRIGISGDGRYVSFYQMFFGGDLVTFDRVTTTTTRDNVAPDGRTVSGDGTAPSLSYDGRSLAFVTSTGDVLIRDRVARTTELVASTRGNHGASITPDARFVAWGTLTGVAVRDRQLGQTTLIPSQFAVTSVALSPDARYVSYSLNDVGCDVYDRLSRVYITLLAAYCSAPAGDRVAFTTLAPLLPEDANGLYDLYLIRLDSPIILPPSNLSDTITNSVLKLTWSESIGVKASSYVLEAGSAPGARDLAVVETSTRATSFSAPISRGGRYYVRVRSKSGSMISDPSNEIVVDTAVDTPGAPGPNLPAVSGSTVVLTWRPPVVGGPVRGYRIEVASVLGYADLAAIDTPSTRLAYTAVGVTPGTYWITLRATNEAGMSEASNYVIATVR